MHSRRNASEESQMLERNQNKWEGTKQEHFSTFIKKRRRWNYIGLVLRMNNTWLPRQAFGWTSRDKRKQSRPRDILWRTITIESATINIKAILNLAFDQRCWETALWHKRAVIWHIYPSRFLPVLLSTRIWAIPPRFIVENMHAEHYIIIIIIIAVHHKRWRQQLHYCAAPSKACVFEDGWTIYLAWKSLP
jgi:hypothetical protein